MTGPEFEKRMRYFLRRDPFRPFVVRTDQDQSIVIESPEAVALAAGGAGYIGKDQLFFIESAQVVDIQPFNEQTVS
jgi:hypothetical protein